MNGLASVFAPMIESMLEFREALGYSRLTHSANLQNFDRYCAERCTGEAVLTESLVWGYLNELNAKKRSGIKEKAASIRLFGKYLSATGQEAYVLPDNMFASKNAGQPYVFTDGELASLFIAVDNFPKLKNDPAIAMVPVLFRLIYTCGLRPNEGRELYTENIDFDAGEILITRTKRRKERIVVLSDDMLDLCERYNGISAGYRKDSQYFFLSKDDAPLSGNQMNSLLNECWHLAYPNVRNLPSIRVYDLRHRFASAVLIRWLDEGKDLQAMLPYLSAYMGHESLSETAYYIHILPENLKKSTGVDWAALSEIMPEVTGI